MSDPEASVYSAASGQDKLRQRVWAYYRSAQSLSDTVSLVDAHFALYAALPLLLSKLRHKPVVVHFQGPWAYESATSGNSWARTMAKRVVERAVYRRAQAVVVLSNAFKRVLVERYKVLPWIIHPIPPGVDLERFSPGNVQQSRRNLALPADAWIVVAVRRLVPRMGLDILLEAWQLFLRETSQTDLLLAIVGDGPESAELRAQALSLGIAESVRFIGQVSDESLVDYYRSANVSVVPSTALEGFGLVVLESLASGTPVIATDVGGLPEAVGRLQRSLIVPRNNANALARRLSGALNSDDPLPDRQKCRRYAEAFSWPSVVRETLNIYQQAQAQGPSRKPRVVYLDHCGRLSGAELALLRLLAELKAIDGHVILGEEGPIVRRLQDAGVSLEVLPFNDRARDLKRDRIRPSGIPPHVVLSTSAYVLRLARRLRQLRPDLVHTNSLKAAVYGGLAARLAGIPVIWHVRDRISEDYLPESAVRMMRWLAPRVTAGVIANSQTTLSSLKLQIAAGAVIPSPIVFDPIGSQVGIGRRAKSRSGAFTVGMLGRIAPWKGQHVFLDAFARAFPDGAERAVIVGSPLFGESDYEGELRDQAARLALDGRLRFAGYREDIGVELASWNVLVHASVIPEPFGQVVVEGMAAGLPVVAAAAGGPSEIIRDGENGLLYAPGDAAALAAILRRLACDVSLRRRLGTAARRRAKDFEPAVIAAQVMNIYRRVLAKSAAAATLNIFEREEAPPQRT